MATALMSVRELVGLAGEIIDTRAAQSPSRGKPWRLSVREFMAAIAKRTNSQGGDPNRASRAIRWAYATRGVGTYDDVLRDRNCEAEFAALVASEHTEFAETGSVIQTDPKRFAPVADRLQRIILKEIDEAAVETERIERAVADERVETARRERADELRQCRDHLDSALDAEAVAVSEAESLRRQLVERQAVVAAFEARVQALEASQQEWRAAKLRERELRVKTEVEAARIDAECRSAMVRAEAAEAQADRWRDVAAQAATNAELRVKDVERLAGEHVAEIHALYERFTSPRRASRSRGEAPSTPPAQVREASRREQTA